MNREDFIAFDNKKISLCIFNNVQSPRAVVQILHGMSEHIARYRRFAQFLNENGIIVVGDDHRGHGENAEIKGHDDGDIALNTVRDAKDITAMLKERFGLPIIVLGHSYGSFLLQEYLLQGSDDIAGAILSGSAYQGGLLTKFGSFVANQKCKKNADKAGDFFSKITFTQYDKKIGEGKAAWISRDADEVAKYNADELCGFTCSNNFYRSMLNMALNLYKPERLIALRKNLKLLIVSGDADPVGGNGKLVEKLYKTYQSAGLTYVQMRLYSKARHEILNETNRVEVMQDILDFINDAI